MSKVALVGTELCTITSATGGLERLVQGWALALAERYDVVLVDMRPDDATTHEINGVPVLAVSSPEELARTLRAFGPEVVQTNNRCLWDTGDALRVNTFHNYPQGWSSELGGGGLSKLRSAIAQQTTTTVSRALGAQVESMFALGQGQVRVTYPFVAQEFLNQSFEGGGGILFPSRLLAKKGPEQVLAAAASLGLEERLSFLDYVTPFLRTSTEYLSIRDHLVRSKARLRPHEEHPIDLAAIYAKADLVVVVATEPEGMGLVALEAQGVGTPVLTAGPGGLKEATFVPNEHLGQFDPASLAGGIARALERDVDSSTKESIAQVFSLEASTAALEATWNGQWAPEERSAGG